MSSRPDNRLRGQPGNRGQFRSACSANDLKGPPNVVIEQAHMEPPAPNTELVVTGNGPWSCQINVRDSKRFSELLSIVKSVSGRAFDGRSKLWVMPSSSELSLSEAIRKAQQKGFVTHGGPTLEGELPRWEAKASLVHDALVINLRYEQTEQRETVKSLGAKWDPENKEWSIRKPDTLRGWERLVETLRSVNIETSIPDDVLQATTQEQGLVAQQIAKLETLPITLRNYQLEGVKFVLEQKNALIADETGLGKTVQALSTIAAREAFPAVIVCPASLRSNWFREASRMFPDREVVSLEKAPKDVDIVNGDVLIVGYESLSKRKDFLPNNVKAVVCDEVHFMQSSKAARTKAATELIKNNTTSDATVLGLSATPVRNRPKELVPFLDASGMLSRIGSKSFFYNRYCDPTLIWNGRKSIKTFDGASNIEELHQKMADTIMIRRRKTDVLDDLPSKTTIVSPFDLPAPLQRVYNNMASDLGKQLVDQNTSALTTMIRYAGQDPLRTSSPTSVFDHLMIEGFKNYTESLFDELDVRENSRAASSAKGVTSFTEMRKLLSVLKRPAIAVRIQDFLDEADPAEKMIVFAHHRALVEGLSKEFNAGMVIGGQSDKERDNHIDTFVNEPEPRLLVCSIGAAEVGLNLQRANNILFAEQPWTPAECEQAEGRCYRIGQSRGVMVEYLVAANTLDEYVARIIQQKRQVTGNLLDGAGNWDNELSGHIQNWLELQSKTKRNTQLDMTEQLRLLDLG